jgi:hypothetical protein
MVSESNRNGTGEFVSKTVNFLIGGWTARPESRAKGATFSAAPAPPSEAQINGRWRPGAKRFQEIT